VRRAELLYDLARRIAEIGRPHPVRVAIDGPDAAGKTTLADDLVEPLRRLERPVIRATIDAFHFPRAHRYRKGRLSPEGYYHDSFDLEALRARLLHPLGPTGDRRYQLAAFDWRAEQPITPPIHEAPPDAVLLFDAIFAQRPELAACWEYVVYLDVTWESVISRALLRDGAAGSAAELGRLYHQRYIPAQQLYQANCHPRERADVVVVYDNLDHPTLL
jgi:uridine kinase